MNETRPFPLSRFHAFTLGLAHETAELLFPVSCVGCGRYERGVLCPACQTAIAPARPSCHVCGVLTVTGSTCYRCLPTTPLAGVIALGPYRDPVLREAIRLLKFHGVRPLAETLGGLLARRVAAIFNSQFSPLRPSGYAGQATFNSVLVPVPLYPRRERERGFNQARLLAEALAHVLGLSVVEPLSRTRATSPQTSIHEASASHRRRNVAGAFAADLQHPLLAGMHAPPSSDVVGTSSDVGGSTDVGEQIGRVILIDDVLTSGATLLEAAATLRAAGIPEVWAAVVARGAQKGKSE